MDNLEIYTYTREDLIDSIQTIEYPKGNTEKKCGISNVLAPLYNCKNNRIGLVSFTNNVTDFENKSFTTSIGTIVTPHGTLVVNFNYNNFFKSQFLPNNKTVKTKPTFTSGLYENYKNIDVTVISLDDAKSTRILNITY
jgi:hypothetical protein